MNKYADIAGLNNGDTVAGAKTLANWRGKKLPSGAVPYANATEQTLLDNGLTLVVDTVPDVPNGSRLSTGDIVMDDKTPTQQYSVAVIPMLEKIGWIQAEAMERIITIAPEWKQRNMIARSVELSDIRIGGGSLNETEQAEQSAMQSIWDRIKAIRAFSNVLGAGLTETTTQADITTADWPE